MWKRFELDGKMYLIKHTGTVNEASHKVHVTDLIYLWCEEIKEDSLLQRCKGMNKLLEASDEVLLNLVWTLLEGEADDVIMSFTDNDSGKHLNLQTNLDGLKFKIRFELVPANSIQFFEEVSCPLLSTVYELEKRQKLLVDVIKKKDLEIAEYKLEGAKISRKAVETDVFDPQSFSRKCVEDIGVTKGLVLTQPSQVFTPVINQLLKDITDAPVITHRENHDESSGISLKNKNKGPVKLKSPTKAKKSKMYDDEDEICDQEEIKEGNKNTVVESFELKKELKIKPSKGNARPKIKKALPNL